MKKKHLNSHKLIRIESDASRLFNTLAKRDESYLVSPQIFNFYSDEFVYSVYTILTPSVMTLCGPRLEHITL